MPSSQGRASRLVRSKACRWSKARVKVSEASSSASCAQAAGDEAVHDVVVALEHRGEERGLVERAADQRRVAGRRAARDGRGVAGGHAGDSPEHPGKFADPAIRRDLPLDAAPATMATWATWAASASSRTGNVPCSTCSRTAEVIAMTLDRRGRIAYCNRYLSDLVGWDRDELIGRDYFATLEPYQAAGAMDELLEAVAHGGPSPFSETDVHTRKKGDASSPWQATRRSATRPARSWAPPASARTSRPVARPRCASACTSSSRTRWPPHARSRRRADGCSTRSPAPSTSVPGRSGSSPAIACRRWRCTRRQDAARLSASASDTPEEKGPRARRGRLGSASGRVTTRWRCRRSGTAPWWRCWRWRRSMGSRATRTVRGSAIGMGNQIAQFLHRHREDARRRAILNAAFDCIVLLDTDDAVAELNPATERAFGRQRDDLIGVPFADHIVAGADVAAQAGLDRPVPATGRRWTGRSSRSSTSSRPSISRTRGRTWCTCAT